MPAGSDFCSKVNWAHAGGQLETHTKQPQLREKFSFDGS